MGLVARLFADRSVAGVVAPVVAGHGRSPDRRGRLRAEQPGLDGGRAVTDVAEDPATGEEAETRRMLYFPVPVFDISQCDVVDPEKAATAVITERLTGEDPEGIFDAVVDYLADQGWTVTLKPIPGETNGYTMTDGSKRIVIDDRLAPGMLAKVGLHEAAHSALHADDADGEYVRHRGIKETEAKSVTYVSAGLLGLDTSTYSIGYIAGWSDCDPKVIKDTASRVLRCAHMFAEALTESPVSETAHAGPRLDPADLDPSNLNPSRVGVDASVALSL